MKFDSLLDKVVVITGASSGAGKLAAEKFLLRGAKVVMAARSIDAMEQHLQDLNMGKDRAIAVETDVSDRHQVEALARRACDHFGRIDVWVNNAAVALYGSVDQLTYDEIHRVIEVVMLGQIYGMKVAYEVFRNQHYGNLINVTSAVGKAPIPLQSAYVAAKHGVIGFAGALREEIMARPHKDIDVSVLLPASFDTPLFTHARSKLGRQPKPIPPVYDPELLADAIIDCALNPKPEVAVGRAAGVMVAASRLMPRVLERYMALTAISSQLSDQPKAVDGQDNLYAPMPGTNTIYGGVAPSRMEIGAYARRHPLQVALAAAIPIALVYFGVSQARRRLMSAVLPA